MSEKLINPDRLADKGKLDAVFLAMPLVSPVDAEVPEMLLLTRQIAADLAAIRALLKRQAAEAGAPLLVK